jgi:NADH/NAD ratio-sensing transcriptional regulator Rex
MNNKHVNVALVGCGGVAHVLASYSRSEINRCLRYK